MSDKTYLRTSSRLITTKLSVAAVVLLFFPALNSFKPTEDLHAQIVLDARVQLGEGSIWHPKESKLYWVDIEGKSLHVYDPELKVDRKLELGSRVGTIVPVESGGVLVALQSGIHYLNTNTGELSLVNNPLRDTTNLRFNDGKCDPSGRFWVGTLALDSRKKGGVLYRMDKDKSVTVMLDSVGVSNGIVWTEDKKTMYYNDTPTGTIQGFDYDDKTGKISNRRVVVQIPKGGGWPDGMTIDADGNLWVALWGSGTVAKFDPRTGKLLQKIMVPAPNVSSCAFGGKNLETLYITSARVKLTEDTLKKYPMSGGLFSVKPGVRGVPAVFFKNNIPLDSIRFSDPFILADSNSKSYYMTGTGGLLWKSKDLKTWEGPHKVAQTDSSS